MPRQSMPDYRSLLAITGRSNAAVRKTFGTEAAARMNARLGRKQGLELNTRSQCQNTILL